VIKREALFETIQTALARSRVVALVGPRQSGKTTLARQFVPVDSVNYFDLEDLICSPFCVCWQTANPCPPVFSFSAAPRQT